ncbi:ATP-binding protein [Cupriavidus pauculus]|uniref:ATP-binding protein n=1 Tax=Cupriavidus pauculus TaxID=82633 RepID=UPI001EE313B4|nr:ATP-binding protein [Cupriavidus pauculus]GJG96779.1 hybrid sensor histidine kinase/response regulator [Cupriavidus pauculus]
MACLSPATPFTVVILHAAAFFATDDFRPNCRPPVLATPFAKPPSEIHLLRHYQRRLLIAGGGLLSLALLLALALTIWTDVRDYIGEGRAVYNASKAMFEQELDKRHAAMRSNVVRAELVWQATGAGRSIDDFHTGVLITRRDSSLVQQLHLGNVSPTQPASRFARYLAFSDKMAYTMTANAQEYGMPFAGYMIAPAHGFLSMAWPQSGWSEAATLDPDNAAQLIERLAPDMRAIHDGKAPTERVIFWEGPIDDPLSKARAVRLIAPAFDKANIFAVFVSSIPVAEISDWLRASSHDGSFMVFDATGNLLGSTAGDTGIDSGLPMRVVSSGVWREKLESSDYLFRDGVFSISELLPSTGWSVVYAFSWKTILAARASFLTGHIAGAALLMGLLWALILAYLRKVLNPLLRRSQEVFDREMLNRAIVDAAPSGLCLISNEDGRVLLGNHALAAYMCEGEPIESRLLKLGRVTPREGRAQLTVAKPTATHGQAQRCDTHELGITTRDGVLRHLLVSVVHTRFLSDEALLCAVTDITERKQLEKNLIDARQAAEAASGATATFLATMSHEIRTPLNGILGNLELLSHSKLDSLQRDRLLTIDRSSRALLDLIGDILDYSKIESGQLTLERVDFDLVEMVETAISIFVPAAKAKGLKIYYDVALDIGQSYIGDPTRVRQILVNLLSNAVKFTDAGEISVSLDSVALNGEALDPTGPMVCLQVADTGIGMSEAVQARLFSPFEQGDPSMTRRYGGTGLGLALCQRLCLAMGGSIDVDSRPGHGSRLTVKLPLVAQHKKTPPPLRLADVVVHCEAPSWRAHLRRYLEHWGLRCACPTSSTASAQSNAIAVQFVANQAASSCEPCGAGMLQSVSTIILSEDGPRHPVTQNNHVLLSCYSLSGLRQALHLAQNFVTRGGPLDSLPDTRAASVPLILDKRAEADKMRALVIEDHPVNRELLRDQLALMGVDAVVVASVREALQRFASDMFDIVLTDLSMPGTDGYTLARMLRAQGATLPIIAITAHASQDHRDRCIGAGINDVLVKPVTLDQLGLAVGRYVRKGQGDASDRSLLTAPRASRRVLALLKSSTMASFERVAATSPKWDWDVVADELHSVKGAYAVMGYVDVVEHCVRLQARCEEKSPEHFREAFTQLQHLVFDKIDAAFEAAE